MVTISVYIKRLAELAKIRFEKESLADIEKDMASIIALMDTLKDVDLPPDAEGDTGVALSALREDIAGESLPVGLLKRGTPEGEFSIPKIVDNDGGAS